MTLKLDRKIPPYTGGGMTNYIRWNKLDLTPEEIYLIHNNILEPPRCKYCGEKCKFISYFKGYSSHCDSKSCNIRVKVENGRKVVLKRQDKTSEYKVFVQKNIDFYRNLDFPTTDIFDGEIIDSIESFKKKLGKINLYIFNEERTCILCKQKFIYNKFIRDKCYCSSKKCRVPSKIKYVNEYVLYSKDIDFDIFLLNKRYNSFTNEELLEVCKRYSKDKVILLIRRLAIEYNSFFLIRKTIKDPFSFCYNKIILDEMKNKCVVCGREYVKYDVKIYLDKNNNISVSKDRIGALYSCKNKKCYYRVKTMGFEEYKESPESIKIASQKLRDKIRNGTFTPCVTNSYTSRINLKFDNIAFRSTWELYFYLFQKENGVLLNYENIRIPYYDSKSETERIYIVDFNIGDILYEIKPNEKLRDQNVIDKELYTEKFCLKNNMKYIIITDEWFRKHYDSKLLDVLPDLQRERCKRLLKQFEE